MVSTRNPRYRKLKITSFEDINPLCNHHSYKPGHITGVRMCACVYICVHVCTYVCMCVYMYVCVQVYVGMYACVLYMCMCVCMFVCIYS